MAVPGLYSTDWAGDSSDPQRWQATELCMIPPDEQSNPYFSLDGDIRGFTPVASWRKFRNDYTELDAEFRQHKNLQHARRADSSKLDWHIFRYARGPDSTWVLESTRPTAVPIPAPLTATQAPTQAARSLDDAVTEQIPHLARTLSDAARFDNEAAQRSLEVTYSDVSFRKSLAQGGFGTVALYDVHNPNGTITPIVVKFPLDGDAVAEHLLKVETGYHDRFQGARHIVQPFYGNQNATQPVPGFNPNPPPQSAAGRRALFGRFQPGIPMADEFTAFLATEYLNLGDLFNVVGRLRRMGLHWPNHALWSLFFCLVKGVSAMAHPIKWYKDRANWDPRDAQDEDYDDVPQAMKQKPARFCHLDLDSTNVFVTWDDAVDQNVPVFKVADFGLSRDMGQVQRDRYLIQDDRQEMIWGLRRVGKSHSRAPEQFHETWDYLRYPNRAEIQRGDERFFSLERQARPRIAGRYRHQMNIYCIGFIMWAVFTGLDSERPWNDVHWHWDNSHMPNLTTYGWRLADASYGRAHKLRKLVMQCMASNPNDRPNLKKLFRKCREGLAASSTPQDIHQTRQWARLGFRQPLQRRLHTGTTNEHVADHGPLRRQTAPAVASPPPFLTPNLRDRQDYAEMVRNQISLVRPPTPPPLNPPDVRHRARELVENWATRAYIPNLATDMQARRAAGPH